LSRLRWLVYKYFNLIFRRKKNPSFYIGHDESEKGQIVTHVTENLSHIFYGISFVIRDYSHVCATADSAMSKTLHLGSTNVYSSNSTKKHIPVL